MSELSRAVLASIELFEGLPALEREFLEGRAVEKSYGPGEDLFHEGEACSGIWIIARGAVKVVKTTPAGRQLVVAVQPAPATVAEVPVFDGGPYPATVTSIDPVVALLIHTADFRTLCLRNPPVMLRFLETFGRRLRHLLALVERITFGSIRQRLAQTLLDFAAATGSGQFSLPETQEQLATRLGTVREVVSRNLSRFQAEGLVRLQRREVEILNREGLAAEAETEL